LYVLSLLLVGYLLADVLIYAEDIAEKIFLIVVGAFFFGLLYLLPKMLELTFRSA
jgi:hypothetical protein